MKLRTLLFGAAVTYLLGAAGWRLVSGPVPPRHASAVHPVPSEVRASGGTPAPAAVAEAVAVREIFPIRRATTPAEVREVLRLTKEATADDRAALRDAALNVEDPLVAGNAAKALGRLKLFASDAALLALIEDPRPRVRQDAAIACGLDGRAEALPYLERALAEGDASLRPLVLDALGEIGGRAARALLQGVAEDPGASNTDRVFARSALERMRT